MTVCEFAAKWGVHPNTVANWCRAGLIPCKVKPCKVRVRYSDIPDNALPPVRTAAGRIACSGAQGVAMVTHEQQLAGQFSVDDLT